jgi:hypothetical protein
MAGVLSKAGTSYTSKHMDSPPVIWWDRVALPYGFRTPLYTTISKNTYKTWTCLQTPGGREGEGNRFYAEIATDITTQN